MQNIPKKTLITVASIACAVIFVVSMLLSFGPVVKVELEYQYKHILRDVFHVNDLRALILPQIDLEFLSTKNPQLGMQIPAIFLDEPIVFNVDPENKAVYTAALKQGIAHAAGSDMPGYPGLGYYFAHSSEPDLRNQYNAVFYLLGKLNKGDEIYIWQDQQKYTYEMYDKKVTEAKDLSFLQQTYDQPTVVLQTCWPPGTTQKRLLIFARQK